MTEEERRLGGMTEEELERRLIAGELNEEILIAFKAHLLAPEEEHDIQPMLGRLCDLAIIGLRAQTSPSRTVTDEEIIAAFSAGAVGDLAKIPTHQPHAPLLVNEQIIWVVRRFLAGSEPSA